MLSCCPVPSSPSLQPGCPARNLTLPPPDGIPFHHLPPAPSSYGPPPPPDCSKWSFFHRSPYKPMSLPLQVLSFFRRSSLPTPGHLPCLHHSPQTHPGPGSLEARDMCSFALSGMGPAGGRGSPLRTGHMGATGRVAIVKCPAFLKVAGWTHRPRISEALYMVGIELY